MSIQEQAEAFGFDLAEVKALCKDNLNFLGALLLGPLFRCDFPEIHIAFFQILKDDILGTNKEQASQIAFGLPRGFCKTTLLKLYVVWLILFTDIRYILVVSKAADLAEYFIADVCSFLDNPNIVRIFGNWRSNISRDTLDVKIFTFNHVTYDETGKRIVTSVPRVIQGIGAQTSVRGTNINNERPEVIICEDAQDKKEAESPILNKAFISWFTGTLLKCKSSYRSQCVYLGNMYNEQCLLNVLRNSTEWFSFITSAILAGRKSLWPEFRSYASLMAEFRNDISLQTPEVFLAEVMNDPLAQTASQFDSSLVKEYPFSLDAIPDGSFLTIDPATGLKDGNLTSIVLHWVIDGKTIQRKVFAGPWNEEQTVIQAFIISFEYGVSLIAIEAVAYQAILLNIFVRIMNQFHIEGIEIVPVQPKGRPKNSRIKDYLKRLTAGDDLLHPDARPEIIFQAVRFKPLKTNNDDDTLDSAAYGKEVYEEHWHKITYNSRTYDALGNKAHVWPTHLTSCF